MNGSAIENSCITKYVYRVLNKIINQWINLLTGISSTSHESNLSGFIKEVRQCPILDKLLKMVHSH